MFVGLIVLQLIDLASAALAMQMSGLTNFPTIDICSYIILHNGEGAHRKIFRTPIIVIVSDRKWHQSSATADSNNKTSLNYVISRSKCPICWQSKRASTYTRLSSYVASHSATRLRQNALPLQCRSEALCVILLVCRSIIVSFSTTSDRLVRACKVNPIWMPRWQSVVREKMNKHAVEFASSGMLWLLSVSNSWSPISGQNRSLWEALDGRGLYIASSACQARNEPTEKLLRSRWEADARASIYAIGAQLERVDVVILSICRRSGDELWGEDLCKTTMLGEHAEFSSTAVVHSGK